MLSRISNTPLTENHKSEDQEYYIVLIAIREHKAMGITEATHSTQVLAVTKELSGIDDKNLMSYNNH